MTGHAAVSSGWLLRQVAVALVVLVSPLAAVAPGAGGVERAHASPAAGRSAVEVVIDQLAPRVPGRGDVVDISGHLLNRSDSQVSPGEVRLRVSPAPLTSRSDVTTVTRHPEVRLGGPAAVSQPVPGPLRAGERVPFRLSVPVAKLGLHRHGVYVLGVEVAGTGRAGVHARLGLTSTFLPWIPDRSRVHPTRVALLWPLVDRPRIDARGLFVDDGLTSEIDEGGRLSRLVTDAAGAPVTWVVDPSLLDAVTRMSRTYQIRDGKGLSAGKGKAPATAWLEELRGASEAAPVLTLPYADPDVVALRRAGFTSDIERAVSLAGETAQRVLERPVTVDVAWPADDAADVATVRALRAADMNAIVLRDHTLPLSEALTYTQSGKETLEHAGSDLTALISDSGVRAALTARADSPTLKAQRVLAELAMISAERPGDVQTILVAPPRRWDPDPVVTSALVEALNDAPWVEPVSIAKLRSLSEPQVDRGPLIYPKSANKRELPGSYLRSITGMRDDLTLLASILTQPDRLMADYVPAVLRTESTAWRKDRPGGRAFRDTVQRSLGEMRDAVRIISRGHVTLSSRTGTIPITITNNLRQDVTVQLDVTPRLTRRLHVGEVKPQRIEAGHKVTVEVPAEAVANGIVKVDTRLRTPDGTPYGEVLPIRVRATNYGFLGLSIVGAAVVLLFISVAVRNVRRVRAAIARQRQAGRVERGHPGGS
ncbi:MAG: DUF6049 family protein [Carbonactinosporaceae bacterium]